MARQQNNVWQCRASGLAVLLLGLTIATAAADPTAVVSEHAEPPLEVYTRIAKGALRCWFGASGSLKKTHVFHADVPPGDGAAAEVVLHERDIANQNPRSIRAYRVKIASTGAGSRVETENFRFPRAVALDLSADIGRWAAGKSGCSVVGIGGWTAEQKKPDEAPPAKSRPKKNAKKQP